MCPQRFDDLSGAPSWAVYASVRIDEYARSPFASRFEAHLVRSQRPSCSNRLVLLARDRSRSRRGRPRLLLLVETRYWRRRARSRCRPLRAASAASPAATLPSATARCARHSACRDLSPIPRGQATSTSFSRFSLASLPSSRPTATSRPCQCETRSRRLRSMHSCATRPCRLKLMRPTTTYSLL